MTSLGGDASDSKRAGKEEEEGEEEEGDKENSGRGKVNKKKGGNDKEEDEMEMEVGLCQSAFDRGALDRPMGQDVHAYIRT